MSGREAADALGALGVPRESARQALLAGVAGVGRRTRGSIRYDTAQVYALVERARACRALEGASPAEWCLAQECREGIFVARVRPREAEVSNHRSWKGVDMTAPMGEQLDAVRMWWRVATLTKIWFRFRMRRDGFIPFVATVGGFVTLGAEMVGLESARIEAEPKWGDQRDRYAWSVVTAFTLRPPGEWFEPLRGGRLPVTQGGPWQLWSPELAEERALPSPWVTTIGA
jgi:hypothetical protein